MTGIDIEKLLEEVSPDAPGGEDLEYDAAFIAMEQAATGQPEKEMGETKIEAVPPDWRGAKNHAIELMGRTKDLRVGVCLVRAAIQTNGFPGFAAALKVLHGLIERHWPHVHPELDPDDDLDPMMRVNALAALKDRTAMLDAVAHTPLVTARGHGSFSLYNTQVASGELPAPEEGEAPSAAAIDAAFLDCEVESLQETATALAEVVELVTAIEAVLTEQVGAAQSISLSELARVVQQANQIVSENLVRRGVGEAAAEGEAAEGGADGAAPGAAAVAPPPAAGDINTREDVIRFLDKMCTYFAKHEPSSPVPILLVRAKRLVSKDFMSILTDLAPDGLPQAEIIRGLDSGEE